MNVENWLFTADTHLFHRNIISYTDRPWPTVDAMHKALFNNFAERMTDKTDLWVVGDAGMLSNENIGKLNNFFGKLPGKKHLVLGNHDEARPRAYIGAGFSSIHTAFWFEAAGKMFYMMHDPAEYIVIEKEENSILLCGHVHTLFKHLFPEKRLINVGVDVWDYRPIDIKQLLELVGAYDREGKVEGFSKT